MLILVYPSDLPLNPEKARKPFELRLDGEKTLDELYSIRNDLHPADRARLDRLLDRLETLVAFHRKHGDEIAQDMHSSAYIELLRYAVSVGVADYFLPFPPAV